MTPESISPIYTRLARLSTWLLLTGLIFFATAHVHPTLVPTSNPHHAVDTPALIFPITILPPLFCFLGTTGIIVLAVLRRPDHIWLSTHLFSPALAASLAALALAFYLVYKDGLAVWVLMETVAAIIAGVYSAAFIAASIVVRRKYRVHVKREERGGGDEHGDRGVDVDVDVEGGRGDAPQIPEVERVASLKDEVLPSSRETS